MNNSTFVRAVSQRFGISEDCLSLAANHKRAPLAVQQKLYGRHEHTADLQDDIRVCRLWLQPGTVTTVHLHRSKSHFFLVEEGDLSLWTETDGKSHCSTDSFCFIPAGVPHQLRNEGTGTLRLLEVMRPATFDDKVVLLHPQSEQQLVKRLTHELGISEGELNPYLTAVRSSAEVLVSRAERRLAKPYGHNWIVLTQKDYGVSFVQMDAGQSTSFHLHHHRRELFLVRAGQLNLQSGATQRIISEGEWGESTPGVPHRLSNQGTSRLELIEIFTPCLLDDKRRLSDSYSRALGEVTHVE